MDYRTIIRRNKYRRMVLLRPNQVEPVRIGVNFFKQTKKVVPSLMVEPVAFGKSLVISQIAHEVGEKMVVLQPSAELLEQNLEKLKNLGGSASVFSASLKTKEIGELTYATLGSIKSLGAEFRGYKMIIDEADRYSRGIDGMLSKFLKESQINHVLGFTATPLKLQTNSFNMQSFSMLKMLTSRSKHGNFFKDILHVTQIKEMVEMGYWSPLKYEIWDFDTNSLIFNSTKAEYTDKSLQQAYDDQHIEDKILDRLQTLDRKSILIFVPTVEKAHQLASRIPGAEVVWGDMDKKKRKQIIDDFKALKQRIVINVNVLSVGFDHPQLDCIIAGRATASLSWWYQAIGRITRIHPLKEDGLIIDFSGNTKRFGQIEDLYYKKEKIWKLYGNGGVLLTGVPMHEIGEHLENPIIKLTFGMHKGLEVKDAPVSWRNWALKNVTWNKYNMDIKNEILRLKEII